ncbi:MAG: hypothetical protein KDA97_02305, partial [Acidimicrobiales bacterium]|nr:hypothetical protein [Acidimicrobiales bacterium]
FRQRYYLAVTAILATTFVGSQAVALAIGDVLPTGAGLHLAAPLVFAGMLARSVPGRTEVAVAAVAAVGVVASAAALGPAALPAAVAGGVLVGCRIGGAS